MKKTWSILAFAIAGSTGSAALALPIPVSSQLSLRASATVGATTDVDTASDAQGATLDPLSASVAASAAEGNTVASAFGSASASWAGSDTGSVNFDRLGWGSEGGLFWLADLRGPGLDWSYTFTAELSGQLELSWDITTSGDPFGLNGFGFFWNGVATQLDPDTSGFLTRDVVAGETYTFGLDNLANIGASDTRNASMSADFGWVITEFDTPVPEPATLALMGVGLAALGLRRRRRL